MIMINYYFLLFFILWKVTESFSLNESSLSFSKAFPKFDNLKKKSETFVRRDSDTNNDIPSSYRRTLFFQAMIVGATTIGATKTSHALTAKNEALCGTGFFTNIAQYRCTDIGDISDEGKSKNLSTNQEMATDSLLSKLDLSTDDNTATDLQNQSDNTKKSEKSSEVGSNKE